MSPNVPISSLSTTNVSPSAPPVTAAPNLLYFESLFKSLTLLRPILRALRLYFLDISPTFLVL